MVASYTTETRNEDFRGSPHLCLRGTLNMEKISRVQVVELPDYVANNFSDQGDNAQQATSSEEDSTLSDTLYVFDDCNDNTMTSKQIEALQRLQNRILNHGRVSKLGCIVISHKIKGIDTSVFRREAYGIVFFFSSNHNVSKYEATTFPPFYPAVELSFHLSLSLFLSPDFVYLSILFFFIES